MVKITNPAFGGFSGKMDGYVFRKFNGKRFASLRPYHYRTSNSGSAVSNRNRFAAAVAFAKFINSIAELKFIWRLPGIEGFNSFNRIIKNNLRFIRNGCLSPLNIITPQVKRYNRADLLCEKMELNKNGFHIRFQINLSKFVPSDSFLFIVLAFQSPDKPESPGFNFFDYTFELNNLSDSPKLEVNSELTSLQKKNMYEYEVCTVYAAALFNIACGNEIAFTRTIARSFDLKPV